MKKINLILLFSLAVFLSGCSGLGTKFVSIGTGSMVGVYYPTGGAISQLINKKKDVYQIKMTVESTAGSVYNINSVLNKDLDFGIAQSDRQYQAYNGLAEWKKSGKQSDLRSVFSIHSEAVTLIASLKSQIKSIKDLKGKRVNLGNQGSGQLQKAKDVLFNSDVNEKDVQAEYVKAVEAAGLLQDGRIDAFFYTAGHPNGSIKEATSGREKVLIIDIKGDGINNLLQQKPYYVSMYIPNKFYPQALNYVDVNTIGVKATLITSVKVDEDVVYALTKEVFDNFEEFKTLHPAYQTLTKKDMLKGLTAPIHKGALKYYKEAGLADLIEPKLILEESN